MRQSSAGGEGRASIAGIFDGRVDALEEQALLGVHILRFHWRNIEEERVKAVHAVDEPTPLARDLAGYAGIPVNIVGVVPALPGEFR